VKNHSSESLNINKEEQGGRQKQCARCFGDQSKVKLRLNRAQRYSTAIKEKAGMPPPITDLKNNPCDKDLHTEICIIGSGPAGGVLAGRLSELNIPSLVLEYGDDSLNNNADHINGAMIGSGEMDVRYGWSHQHGGASNLWAGRICPFENTDFAAREWVHPEGWPIPYPEMKTFYSEASEVLGVSGFSQFEELKNIKETSPIAFAINASDTTELKSFLWSKKAFKVRDHLTNIQKSSDNIKTLLNANVLHIRENQTCNTIESITVKNPNGKIFKVYAKYVIIAAGGIHTPRILLNSKFVQKRGVGNQHGNVGRYLSTHPKANLAALILNKSMPISGPLFADQPLNNGAFRYGVGLSEKVQIEHKLLNHYVQLSPLFEHQANKAFEKLKSSKLLDSGLINKNRLIQGLLPGAGKLAYAAIGRAAGLQPRAKKFILRSFLDQYPNKENCVSLSSELDSCGVHNVDIKWDFSAKDKLSVIQFFELLNRDLEHRKVGHIEYSGLKEKEKWPLIGIHSHFMGTTRMGEDEKTSVTDGNGKVHGYSNLFISGPSLFPTYGYANPFYTITALALRLGNHLHKIINSG
jgi:choline dehydrogenase-like flavoprotein